MLRPGKPPALLLAGLLCLAAAPRAFSLRTEFLARANAAPGVSGASGGQEVVSGIASVLLTPGVSTAAAAAALGPAGFAMDFSRGAGRWHPVSFLNPMPVAQALAALGALSSVVERAEPDKVYKTRRVPNDPLVYSQYALSQVQAFGAWEYETGLSSRVTVAVIDTGIDASHPEFVHKFDYSASQFCDPGANKDSGIDNTACAPETPTPACFHGTAVAGVAAAQGNNAAGVAGMSWDAKLLSLRVFRTADCSSDCGNNGCVTDDWAMTDAFNFLAGKQNTPAYGKIVANLSLGCPVGSCLGCCGTCNPASPLALAISNAVASGILVFAAAGNGGDPFIDTPADCPGVIAVGATDSQDLLASFSSTDSTMTYKGLTAPGVDVLTTNPGGGYTSATGTSFASPGAAGLAALLWSAKPGASADDIRAYMMNSADDLGDPGPDRSFGRGRINALRAMRLALTGSASLKGDAKVVAYPNPFRPKTQRLVTFTVPADMLGPGLEIKVYTTEGELVRKLSGQAWDGRNEAGSEVASGVYLVRVKTDKDAALGKFAVIR